MGTTHGEEHEPNDLVTRRRRALSGAYGRAAKGIARWFMQGVGAMVTSIFLVFAPCLAGISLSESSPSLSLVLGIVTMIMMCVTSLAFGLYMLRRFSASASSIPELEQAGAIRRRIKSDPEFDGEVRLGALEEVAHDDASRGGLSAAAETGSLTEAADVGASSRDVVHGVDAAEAVGFVTETSFVDHTKKNVTYAQALVSSAGFLAFAACAVAIPVGIVGTLLVWVGVAAKGGMFSALLAMALPALLATVAWYEAKPAVVARGHLQEWAGWGAMSVLGMAPTWWHTQIPWGAWVGASPWAMALVALGYVCTVAMAWRAFERAFTTPGSSASVEPDEVQTPEVVLGFEDDPSEQVAAEDQSELVQSVSDQ